MAIPAVIGAFIGGLLGIKLFGIGGGLFGAIVGACIGWVIHAAVAARKTAPKPPWVAPDIAKSDRSIVGVRQVNTVPEATLAERVRQLERSLASLEPRLTRIEQALRFAQRLLKRRLM